MDYADQQDNSGWNNAAKQQQPTYTQMPGAAAGLNRAIQVKALDKCIGEAQAIAGQLAKATDFAESILARLTGPQDGGEADCCDERVAPRGALGKLEEVQESSSARLRRLFRALEQIDALV